MKKYKILSNGTIHNTETNTFIPPYASSHRFYTEYLEWLAEGNTPDTEIPEETEDLILKRFTSEVQAYLDAKPKERNYDGILSLCTYATSTNPKFALEGQAGVVWRDAVWGKCYEIMALVKAGELAIPTVEELIAELPAFKWPDE